MYAGGAWINLAMRGEGRDPANGIHGTADLSGAKRDGETG